MSLRIYNTLTRRKELFEPLEPGRVNIYVCGPTVYDLPHMGHARSYVAFDVVVRYLRHLGLDVLYVQNITDVGHLTDDDAADPTGEDKVARRARERGLQPMALVESCTRAYFEAMDALNCLRPDISPRATGHIPEMIELIRRLIDAGHAYVVDGSVYFDVESFGEYGKLSRRRLDDQEAGARVEPGAGKRSPFDFALWKSAEGTGHLMRWPSPWGEGFPGWHIECSAMAMKYLGETLDIHGAGVDNIFPHNEDEIAQSECATHRPFARFWMHNGTVLVNGEKMSKSKGNFKTIEEEMARFGPEVLRFWAVSHHYRSPVDYTDAALHDAARGMDKLRTAREGVARYARLPEGPDDAEAAARLNAETTEHRAQFLAGMNDDFNTPVAVAALFAQASSLNRVTASASFRSLKALAALERGDAVLADLAGILGLKLEQRAAAKDDGLLDAVMSLLLEARQTLRRHRDYAAADAIRFALAEQGVVVEDRPEGSTWRRAVTSGS